MAIGRVNVWALVQRATPCGRGSLRPALKLYRIVLCLNYELIFLVRMYFQCNKFPCCFSARTENKKEFNAQFQFQVLAFVVVFVCVMIIIIIVIVIVN